MDEFNELFPGLKGKEIRERKIFKTNMAVFYDIGIKKVKELGNDNITQVIFSPNFYGKLRPEIRELYKWSIGQPETIYGIPFKIKVLENNANWILKNGKNIIQSSWADKEVLNLQEERANPLTFYEQDIQKHCLDKGRVLEVIERLKKTKQGFDVVFIDDLKRELGLK